MAENARNWGYPHPHTTVRLPGPPGRPQALPDVAKYRPEWDPAYTVPWDRIDTERINRERHKRMWTIKFLGKQSNVSEVSMRHILKGNPYPSRGYRGASVDLLQRIAKALDLQLEDIVRREP